MADWKDFFDPFRRERDVPFNHRLIWIWREGWPEPQLTPVDGMAPDMNVFGLKWQPAADGEGRPALPAA